MLKIDQTHRSIYGQRNRNYAPKISTKFYFQRRVGKRFGIYFVFDLVFSPNPQPSAVFGKGAPPILRRHDPAEGSDYRRLRLRSHVQSSLLTSPFQQVDDLQKEVLVLKDRVIEQRAANESRASKQEENMNGLRTHLERLVEDANREDDRIRAVHAELIKLLGAVERLFLSVRCERSPVYKILGKQVCETVTCHGED